MAWKLMIAGVDKTASFEQAPGQARIELHLNDRATAEFPAVPGYVPNRFDSVLAYAQDGVTKLFGGTVMRRSVQPIVSGSRYFRTGMSCTDGMTYLDWAYVTLDYTGAGTVTLKAVLQDIIAQVPGSFGLTLDPAQVTGPSVSEFAVTNKKASELIRDLSTSTSYVARVDGALRLKMFVPGTDSAPYSMTDATPHCLDFVWQDADFTPANKVILTCGASNPWAFLDDISFAANGVASSWVFDVADGVPYTDAGGGGTILVGGAVKNSAVGEFTWTLNASAATATLALVPAVAPGAGTIIAFKRNIQPPFVIIRSAGATPEIEDRSSAPDVRSVATAAAAAAGRLAQLNQQPRRATAVSLDVGWLPGQSVVVNLTSRNVNATFVITDVAIELLSDGVWRSTLTLTESTTYQGSALDQWRSMFGSSSSSSAIVTVATASTTPGAWTAYLGGASALSLRSTTAAPVPNAVRVVAPSTGTYRLRAGGRARNGGVTCQLVLWDLSTNVAAMTPAAIVSTSETAVTSTASLVAGHEYQLRVASSSSSEDVYALWGTLELIG